MSGWMPISSAPKDGTEILAYEPPRHNDPSLYAVVHWSADYDDEVFPWRTTESTRYAEVFTHWQPLPSPPEE